MFIVVLFTVVKTWKHLNVHQQRNLIISRGEEPAGFFSSSAASERWVRPWSISLLSCQGLKRAEAVHIPHRTVARWKGGME